MFIDYIVPGLFILIFSAALIMNLYFGIKREQTSFLGDFIHTVAHKSEEPGYFWLVFMFNNLFLIFLIVVVIFLMR